MADLDYSKMFFDSSLLKVGKEVCDLMGTLDNNTYYTEYPSH